MVAIVVGGLKMREIIQSFAQQTGQNLIGDSLPVQGCILLKDSHIVQTGIPVSTDEITQFFGNSFLVYLF